LSTMQKGEITLIVYTVNHLIEEGWITECFRRKHDAQKRRAELSRASRKDPEIFVSKHIDRWVVKNRDDLVRFGNCVGR